MTDEKLSNNADEQNNNGMNERFRRIIQSGDETPLVPDDDEEDGGTKIFGTDFDGSVRHDGVNQQLPVEDETPPPAKQLTRENPLPPGMVPPAPTPPTPQRALPNPPQALSNTPTPKLSKPAVDSSGMPLPRRVDQIDINATRAVPVRKLPTEPFAEKPQTPRQSGTSETFKSTRRSERPSTPIDSPRGYKSGLFSFSPGCLLKGFIGLLFLIMFIGVAAGSIAVFQYYRIARSLPSIEDLKSHASQFETTRILDRDGNTLYEILDPNAGRRTYVPLSKISPYLVAATIATEDKEFYNHPGFDPLAIGRALWNNYTSGEITSGASTITQQLARNLLFSPQERIEQTVQRKAREIVLAAEITRRYSKDEILELYLNENYYGSIAYGVEAAAETYFGTTATKLDLAQASFLAGLPQAPAVYDIFTNRDATLNRHKAVMLLILETSKEKNCIYVSNSQPVCVGTDDVINSVRLIERYEFKTNDVKMTYPHWVNYIRTLLEKEYDPQTIYRRGFTIYTTLDPELQKKADKLVSKQVADLVDKNVKGGALIAIRPGTGEILAMVGSPDFNNEANSGQVNMAVSPRQPGSSIKPLTYVAAFEKGWTPSTLLWDVASEFPPSGNENDDREPYKPVNYDGKFHGPVLLRDALANSYNIPAVKTLQFVGIYDNPKTNEKDGLIEFAKRLGITTLNREDYGLSLTLGGGEVTLLEMTNAFSTFANKGVYQKSVAITKIVDYEGNTVFEYKTEAGPQVIRPEHAYLISSVLSDKTARIPMFGENPVINLPFRAAVKTGTTNDFRDNWTIGYTPDLAIGVWIGNPDFTPMENTTGLTGAAPIWAAAMEFGIEKYTNNDPTGFAKPDGIETKEICEVSGTEPSKWCPSTKNEIFASNQLPLPKEDDLWQNIEIDTWTSLRASDACSTFTKDVSTINVQDPFARKWINKTDAGKEWAKSMKFKKPYTFTPSKECKEEDPHPTLKFIGLSENERIEETELEIEIQAFGDGYDTVSLLWGEGKDPDSWKTLVKPTSDRYKNSDVIYTWDLEEIPEGVISLKLLMENDSGGYAEKIIHLNMQVPTPTPTDTPEPTETPTETPTDLPTATTTNTEVPTETLVPSETPTLGLIVTDTPTP